MSIIGHEATGCNGLLQGSPEWHQERLGKVTASRVADVVARTKTGWGAMRDNYKADLIVERLTGAPVQGYVSEAMEWGTQCEPEARSAYEVLAGLRVDVVGFVPHPTIEMSGASPDGLVGTDGLVEIKCPGSKAHIDTLLRGKIPEKYILQMTWQMACTGRQWCDFVSYDPRMPENLRLFVKRVPRDDVMVLDLEDKVREFLAEVHAKTVTLQEMAA